MPSHFTRSAYLSFCWESNDKAIHGNTDAILPHCFLLKPYQHLLFLVDLLFSENSILYTSYILVLKSTSKVKILSNLLLKNPIGRYSIGAVSQKVQHSICSIHYWDRMLVLQLSLSEPTALSLRSRLSKKKKKITYIF